MAKKVGRPKKAITKTKYIEKYWEANTKKLNKVFGKYADPKAAYISVAKNTISNSKFASMKDAKEAFDAMVYARTHSREASALHEAQIEAREDIIGKTLDLRKLKNKFSDYIDTDIELPGDIDKYGNEYENRIVGYWEIEGQPYVLAEVASTNFGGSPISYYKYISRTEAGLD